MEQFQPLQLSEETLSLADDITLAELLQSTGAQCWMISALINAQRFHEHFVHVDIAEEDSMLFKLYKINRSLSQGQKSECYRRVNTCARIGQATHARKREARENNLNLREQRQIQRKARGGAAN